MKERICKNCKHFRQHYGLDERRLFRVYCGHCVLSRMKKKRPDTPGCEHFEQGSEPSDAFVTKAYLSRELLRYVLNMELLPEIGDEPVP